MPHAPESTDSAFPHIESSIPRRTLSVPPLRVDRPLVVATSWSLFGLFALACPAIASFAVAGAQSKSVLVRVVGCLK